jgi:hypothetical protein
MELREPKVATTCCNLGLYSGSRSCELSRQWRDHSPPVFSSPLGWVHPDLARRRQRVEGGKAGAKKAGASYLAPVGDLSGG